MTKSADDNVSLSISKGRRSPSFRRQTSFCMDSDEKLDQISPTLSGDSILVIQMPETNNKQNQILEAADSKSTIVSAEVHPGPKNPKENNDNSDDEDQLIGAVGGSGIKVVVAEYRPRLPDQLMDLDSPPDDTHTYHSGFHGPPVVAPKVTLLRPSSPLAVVPELEAWEEDENMPLSVSSLRDEISLERTASTESGGLETILEERRRQLIRQNAGDEEDDEPRAKVRYNDTGSLEEVNDEVLDSFVDEESDLSIEEVEAAMLREQYKKLWRLRATFEEEIEDTIVSEEPHIILQEIVITEDATDDDSLLPISEKETESEVEKDVEKELPPVETQHQHLTIAERRDNYKSILSKRLQKKKAAGLTPGSSADDSFDSVDTEGSSTDASRLEVATTSLDSTTDTTDSPGDGQASRLQQMKADSGYKSLETATSNGGSISGSTQKAPKLSRKQIQFALNGSGSDSQLGGTTGSSADKDEGVSVDFETSIEDTELEKTMKSIKRFPSLSRTPTQGSLCGELESPPAEDPSLMTVASCKSSVFHRFFRGITPVERRHPMLTRDFSIDEKSDGLFREFCRLDPAFEMSVSTGERARSPRLHPRSGRLQHRHTMDAGDGVITIGAPTRPTRRKMSAQDNIEEEIIRLEQLRSPMRDQSQLSITTIPVIQVAEEDTTIMKSLCFGLTLVEINLNDGCSCNGSDPDLNIQQSSFEEYLKRLS
uniref:Uncharacterized protein n=1 Tax=Strigamia maritima TaxID=126957 RepID=T1IK80_STRMM